MAKESNKYNRLAKNTLIFMIGNFGSKLIAFIIVPFYTFVLTTEQYGTIDLFTTTINIIIPFVILGLNEAVLRFLVGKEIKKETVATDCFLVFLFGTAIVCLLYPLYSRIPSLSEYSVYFLVLLILMSFNQIFLQYLRGIGLNTAFAANGIIITLVTVTSNLVFLLWFKWGIAGYFYSMILAQGAGALQIILVSKFWRDIRFKYYDFSKLKKMLIYSFPLIPNALMWWIMNAGDKFMINYFIGTSANGIYSVAHKFPTIINLVYSVFMQAWQISAIEEEKSKDRSEFYNVIYKNILTVLVLVGSVIILISKPLYLTVMNEGFKIAWQCVPPLIIANMFSCLTGFFGTTYVVNLKSKKAFYTTLLGAVCNIVFNFFLIPRFGIIGAALGTMLGYLTACAIRAYDTKQFIKIDLKIRKLVPAIIILLVQYAVLFMEKAYIVYPVEFILLALEMIIFSRELKNIVLKIMGTLNNKIKR